MNPDRIALILSILAGLGLFGLGLVVGAHVGGRDTVIAEAEADSLRIENARVLLVAQRSARYADRVHHSLWLYLAAKPEPVRGQLYEAEP